MIDPYISDAAAVVKAFGTDIEAGLTAQQASQRPRENGPNELLSAARVPARRRLLRQSQDPLIYFLLAAIAVALLAWGIEGTEGEGRHGWPNDLLVLGREWRIKLGLRWPCGVASVLSTPTKFQRQPAPQKASVARPIPFDAEIAA